MSTVQMGLAAPHPPQAEFLEHLPAGRACIPRSGERDGASKCRVQLVGEALRSAPPPPWQVPTLSGPGAADEGAGEGEGKLVASPVLQGLHTGGCAPVTCKLFH